jgi:hypothetical protein
MSYLTVLPRWLSLGLLGVSSLLLLGYTTRRMCPYFGGKKKSSEIVIINDGKNE